MATTAITALVAGAAYAQQAETDEQLAQQRQDQQLQADQQAQQVTVRDGDTVVIRAEREEAEIHLRVQAGLTEMQPADPQAEQPPQEGAIDDDAQQQAVDRPAQPPEDQQAVIEDRQDLQAAELQHLSVDNLIGTDIRGAQDENIGNINDVLLTQEGEVDAVVVDVGGFLGMGTQEVALAKEDIDFMTDAQGNLFAYTSYTREQIEGAPEYDQATWAEQRDEQRLTGDMAAQIQSQDRRDQQVQQPGEMEQHVVMDGGTIIVQAEQESFQLTFQVQQLVEDSGVAAAPAEPGPEVTGAVDPGQMQQVEMDQLRADNLIGSTLYGAGGDNIGNVGDIILTEDGDFDAVIVDVGGFLGIGTREVALGLDEVEFMQDQQGNWHIYTRYTEQQLEAAPEYDAATYAERRDEQRLGVQGLQ